MKIHAVEQNTPPWDLLRAGKPTSSDFPRIITPGGERSASFDDYAMELATEMRIGGPAKQFAGNADTIRGHEEEPKALADYAFTHGVKVQPVGFITDDLERWGTSTDGLVDEDGIAEVKSKAPIKFMQLLYDKARGKDITRPYIPQVQGELFVTKREWCDLIFYNPEFEPLVVRVKPDPSFHLKLKDALIDVLAARDAILKLVA